jgi:hypothetical protein
MRDLFTNKIYTNSCHYVDLLDTDPDTIRLVDIAHALAQECRFNGQTDDFYSVAQHSVYVSLLVPPEYAREALLHDATEAYIKDLPLPLKDLLPSYRAIEGALDSVIRAKYGLPPEKSREVIHADKVMLAREALSLFGENVSHWPVVQEFFDDIYIHDHLEPHEARRFFLARCRELGWEQVW